MEPFSDLEAVQNPVARARGLANAHYTDLSVYEVEKHALLFRQWAGLGVAADIPQIGDAKPVDFLDVPLVMIRDRSNRVRVFQNICRHRGMILIDAPKKIEGAIRCPYHSWCYATDGRLISTPHVGGPGINTHEDIDRDALGLIEVASYIWRDIIWVNLSGTAPAFEIAMAEPMERWSEFDQPLFHGGADSRFELALNTNWKLAVENYCESYHLPWVHPGLNSYSRLEDHYNIQSAGCYSGQGTTVYRQLTGNRAEKFPDFKNLSSKWNQAAEYLAIYPNVLLGTHRDHAFAVIIAPLGPEKSIEHVHLYYATDTTEPTLRAQNTAQWKSVLEEDIFVVEGMQRGRHGPGFDGGRFSPAMDAPTHCFHAWVAKTLTEAQNEPAQHSPASAFAPAP